MKKMYVLIAALAVGMALNAKDDVLTIESGDLNFWTETGKYAIIDIDWSNTQVVEWDKMKVEKEHGTIDQYNRMKGEDFVNDWPNVQTGVLGIAPAEANKLNKKKGIKIISPIDEQALSVMTPEQKAEWEKSQAKAEKNGFVFRDASVANYQIKLTIDSIDMGNAAASAFGMDPHNGGAIIVGKMQVFDRASNNLVCSIKINHLKGWGSYSETARMQMIFIALWKEEFPKLLKENGIKMK